MDKVVMSIKVMFDTNTYDYVHENELEEQLKKAVQEGKISIFITHVQTDEIAKIKDIRKHAYVKKLIADISAQDIPTSIGFFGSGGGKQGYSAARWGHFKFVGLEDSSAISDLKRTFQNNPMGNSADLSILLTAVKEMDIFVTNDNDAKRNAAIINERLHKNLKILDNSELASIL